MAAEIKEQPAVLDRIRRDGRPRAQEVARAVRSRRPKFALFVARGTSDHAALYAKYLVETRLGLPGGLASPSTMTVYDARPDLRDVLVVAVSQSGASPDIVEPVNRARAAGAVTVAVTNSADSPLAAASEFHLDVLAGPERAVAATKTYTAELLTLFCFVEGLAGRSGEEAAALPECAAALLRRDEEVARLAVRYRFAEQLVVTARGYNYPTARESALKLMETSYVVAHAFSGADLLHGPMAMIDRGFPVIAVAPEGPGSTTLTPVLERLRDLGADTLVIGDPALVPLGRVGFALEDLGPEWLTPILAILPIQQLAWHLARERASDPDQPRGLHKVTETW
ncbi:MAG: SIS domain-containing protein [Chloroflexota bacterium]|nr:SIS domain-containing protein [Chloroflexota bacterium]